ncbi:MAG: DegT/DnrJ/EryC1/StrS family aminotransferase [Solirubrobacteraceae bacterium]
MSERRMRLAEPTFPEGTLERLGAVLATGNLTQGPVVAEFEEAVAEFIGVGHAVATTSATTAIELTLAALEIGPGDEVLAADFTYPATGNAALQRGADLRLVDVRKDTYTIDPDALVAAITPRTKAVIAVDVFGLAADYGRIEPLLRDRDIPLVCDAACSLGGAIGDRRTGTFGTASCFSFHPRKSLTTGEGGMVTTADGALAERMRRLRNHGTERDGWRATFVEPGFNYRMSDLNAALGLSQVDEFGEVVARRGALAGDLTRRIAGIPGIVPQAVPPTHLHPYQAYVVHCESPLRRDDLVLALRARGVESTLGTYAMHTEPAFRQACGTEPGDLPVAASLAAGTLALPLHQGLGLEDLDHIAEVLDSVVREQAQDV